MSESSPGVRDLPALAGVLARAYSYRQGWPARLAAVRGVGRCWRALAAAAWLLLLVVARQVVRADGRCAVVTLSPGVGLSEQLRASWRGLLVTVAAGVVLETVALWVASAMGVPSGVVDGVSVLLGGLTLVALLVGFMPVVGQGGHDRQVAAARAYAQQQGERRILYAGLLATWPHGQGHMTRLLERLQAEVDADGACLIAYARSEALALQYARHGFRPVPGQGPQTLYRPARGASG